MQNIININSANILTFGFTSKFDLLAKTLTFDISNLTAFQTGGAANVVGIAFQVTDPSGLTLAKIDWTAPQIDPNTQTTFVVDIVSGFALFGWYNLTGVIRDQDGKDYSINLIKEICQPEGFTKNGYVPGIFNIIVNCNTPQLNITELTRFIYKGKSPASVTKTGILSYPPGTLADLDFNFTPIAIGGNANVYTGRYTINNTSLANFDLGDGVSLNISYKVINFEKVVNCTTSLASVLCCMEDLIKDYNNDPYSASGAAIKKKLDKCSYDFMLAVAKEKSGKDASEEAAKIASILGCDCDCSSAIEPQTVLSGGSTIDAFTIIGADAANVDAQQVLGTTQYTIEVKNIDVTNLNNDLSFNINRVDSGTTITFAISFNFGPLASAILEAIGSDDALIAVLQNLVGNTGSILSLDGLAGGCIITLANCNYTLIEANNVAKTIVSINIGGTLIMAPSSLLLSNTSAVAAWLNGLGLGTFSVTLDTGTQTINITSNANPNIITVINFTTTTGALIRQFNRSCIGLVDFLNAVVTYICNLQTANVKFGVANISYLIYNPDGSVTSTVIATNDTLDHVLEFILASEASLFNALSTQGLTCRNIGLLFKTVTYAILDTDGVLGTQSNHCALIGFDALAGIILQKIAANAQWQSNFCGLVANCTAPVCPSLTNPSASFASGTLTVNANGASGTTPIQIRYRIYNSNNTYLIANTTAAALPFAIASLPNGQYEVGVSQQCANNSLWSPFATAISNNTCAVPPAFAVAISGSNFVVTATLTSPQTKIQVRMVDPTGGITNVINDFGATSGTFNIPIPTGNYGDYTFTGSAICDATVVPMFQSAFGAPVILNYANPTANNITASAAYGMSFTDISNGSCSGIPTAFNGVVITHNAFAYTPNLTSGTISVTLIGTPPGSPAIYVRLVLNGTIIIDQALITGPTTYTLTNPSLISGVGNQIGIYIGQ